MFTEGDHAHEKGQGDDGIMSMLRNTSLMWAIYKFIKLMLIIFGIPATIWAMKMHKRGEVWRIKSAVLLTVIVIALVLFLIIWCMTDGRRMLGL